MSSGLAGPMRDRTSRHTFLSPKRIFYFFLVPPSENITKAYRNILKPVRTPANNSRPCGRPRRLIKSQILSQNLRFLVIWRSVKNMSSGLAGPMCGRTSRHTFLSPGRIFIFFLMPPSENITKACRNILKPVRTSANNSRPCGRPRRLVKKSKFESKSEILGDLTVSEDI